MSIELAVSLVVGLVAILGFVLKLSMNQNHHRDRLHERIDSAEKRAVASVKELDEKINADRLRVAEDYVSQAHLDKHVIRPMERGFEDLKELINKFTSK